MRKITLFLTMLLLCTSAMAQIKTDGTLYRLKEKTSGLYLNIYNTSYSGKNPNNKGGVNITTIDESSNNQIFTFETAGEGLKIKAVSGYYIILDEWNVNANVTESANASVIFMEATNIDGEYLLKWVNTFKKSSMLYFKVETANGDNDGMMYPYCDASSTQAATWVLEEVKLTPALYYETLDKPTYGTTTGTTEIVSVKFDGNVVSDFTFAENATNRVNPICQVVSGKTYSLELGYEMQWGDLAIFQIDSKNKNPEKKYGYYACQWRSGGGDPATILKDENAIKLCEELEINDVSELVVNSEVNPKVLTIPYKITIPEGLDVGDVIVVRAIVGNATSGDVFAPKNVSTGGCLDIIFQVVDAVDVTLNNVGKSTLMSSDLHDKYMGTFSASFATKLPSGVTAYYATSEGMDNGYTKLVGITEGPLPANQGFILVSESDNNVTMIATTEDAAELTSENQLGHTAGGEKVFAITENNYILMGGDDGAGFYEWTSGNLAKNKAYLKGLVGGSAKAMKLVWEGETTGVETLVPATDVNAPIYDLCGRRVLNTVKGGIYIQNGKKYIVK